jgi:hypothetical protein
MLPNAGTEKFVSRLSSRLVSFALHCSVDLLEVDPPQLIIVVSCHHS